jgi:radical SAM superfamily enzyme YgiQ (UPF0313 family)
MFKVLFITPPIRSELATPEVREYIQHKKYPLGILSIMTYVKKHVPDCNTKILRVVDDASFKNLPNELASYSPDIVGFPCFSYDLDLIYRVIQKSRTVLPHTHICCGGPHVSFFPKETISLPEVDSIILGDGEKPFLDLCLHLKNKIPLTNQHVYTKSDLQTNTRFTPYLDKNLDDLPISDITLLNDYLSFQKFLNKKFYWRPAHLLRYLLTVTKDELIRSMAVGSKVLFQN